MFKTSRLITASALLAVSAAASFSGVARAASGGATSATLTAGALTVAGGVPGLFAATLNGSNQAVYTTLDPYTATDALGTAAGWNVTLQATQFTCTAPDGACPAGGTLPWGSLSIAAPTVACSSSSTCGSTPTVSIVADTAIDSATATKVVSDAANGQGAYVITPGAMETGTLELDIPGNALASIYHSTLTITVTAGP